MVFRSQRNSTVRYVRNKRFMTVSRKIQKNYAHPKVNFVFTTIDVSFPSARIIFLICTLLGHFSIQHRLFIGKSNKSDSHRCTVKTFSEFRFSRSLNSWFYSTVTSFEVFLKNVSRFTMTFLREPKSSNG